jgi:hypothetical protein
MCIGYTYRVPWYPVSFNFLALIYVKISQRIVPRSGRRSSSGPYASGFSICGCP